VARIRQRHKIAIIKKARFYAVHHLPIGFWILLNLQKGFRKREVIWHFGDQQGIPMVLEHSVP
jgi:hypothetical protein